MLIEHDKRSNLFGTNIFPSINVQIDNIVIVSDTEVVHTKN